MNNSENHTKIGMFNWINVVYFLCQYKTYELRRQYISKITGIYKFTPNSQTNSDI